MPIYFIRAGDGGPVKIGYAQYPEERLAYLQTGSAVRLDLLQVLEGDKQAERALHERFATSRIRGEWHQFSPDMLSVGTVIPIPRRERPLGPPRRRGRPPTGRDPVVSGRVPAATIDAMDAWAGASGLTRSEAMGLLLQAALKRPPKVKAKRRV